jgi:hypothetical protein
MIDRADHRSNVPALSGKWAGGTPHAIVARASGPSAGPYSVASARETPTEPEARSRVDTGAEFICVSRTALS